MKTMRKRNLRNFSLLLGILLMSLLYSSNQANASSSLGSKCSKVNSFQTIKGNLAICLKKSGKQIWVLANKSQIATYQKQQLQVLIDQRKKNLEFLSQTKVKFQNVSALIPALNATLIDNKKSAIENAKNQVLELGRQKESELQNKTSIQNSLTTINNSISTTQTSINSLQNQINSQQNTVNFSKANNDSAYNAYVSAKAQSDYLSYSYQNALSSNTSMMTAKVLCDFGFGSCGIYNSAQYNYNASIISQYNAASARTSSAYASYVSYNSQYASDLNGLNTLKAQQSQLSANLNSLNSQRNQASQNFVNVEAKITSLESQIIQANNKLTPLANGEVRIAQDLDRFALLKEFIENKSVELVNSIDEFLKVANDSFIATTSVNKWNDNFVALNDLQKDLDSKIAELKLLVSNLDSFLNTL